MQLECKSYDPFSKVGITITVNCIGKQSPARTQGWYSESLLSMKDLKTSTSKTIFGETITPLVTPKTSDVVSDVINKKKSWCLKFDACSWLGNYSWNQKGMCLPSNLHFMILYDFMPLWKWGHHLLSISVIFLRRFGLINSDTK